MSKKLKPLGWDEVRQAGDAALVPLRDVAADLVAVLVVGIPDGFAAAGVQVDLRGLTSPTLPFSEVVGMVESFAAQLREELNQREAQERGGALFTAPGSPTIN